MTKRQLLINQPQVGQLIRAIRLETGLTQEQFAAELGVTYPTINRWENGHNKPSPLAMQKILKMLRQMRRQGKELLEMHFLED